jgi:hypothetical protein
MEVTLSDGAYFSPMFFSSQLLSIAHLLSVGDVIIIKNYISQPVLDGNVVVICLDVSVTGTSLSVIGNPSEYKLQPTSCIISRNSNFIGVSSDDFCDLCNGTPSDWSLYGQLIVDSIQGTITTSHSTDLSSINKSRRFAAYQMYTRVKHGYLGKGNRTPLPKCVTDYIRSNFPDKENCYVGFLSNDDK